VITFSNGKTLSTNAYALGVNQTWSNKISLRALETQYTNSTGRAIYVAVTVRTDAKNGNTHFVRLFAYVGGAIVATAQRSLYGLTGVTMQASVIFMVPTGATYQVNRHASVGGINMSWWELTT
jgi:hypothetical protein